MVLAVLHRTLIVTEQCLLSPTRNPNLDRAGIEHLLKVPGLAYYFGGAALLLRDSAGRCAPVRWCEAAGWLSG